MNGPAISAHGRTVAIAWFTAAGDQGRAFVAFSQDAGATFGAPIRLDDTGSLGRVGVAMAGDDSAVASWIERIDQRSELRVRRVDASGHRSAAQTVSATIGGGRTSGYPRLARRGGEILFAWTEGPEGETTVRTAAARLP